MAPSEIHHTFLLRFSASVNQFVAGGLTCWTRACGRLGPGEVLAVAPAPIIGATFIERAMRFLGKSTSVTVTMTFCCTLTTSAGSLTKRSLIWLTWTSQI